MTVTQVYTRDVVKWALGEAARFPSRKNSGFDTRVLVAICAHADATGIYAWVGQKKIAAIVYGVNDDEVTDSHIRSVRRSVDFLAHQQALVVDRHAHRLRNGKAVNGYHLGYAVVEEVVYGEIVEEVA